MNRQTLRFIRLCGYLPPVLTPTLALVLLLWTTMFTITNAARGNQAGFLFVQALEFNPSHHDAGHFLVGDFGVNDLVSTDKAVALWESNANRNSGYLYMLALYSVARYDDVLATLAEPLATPSYPLEGMILGHTQYALGEISAAGEVWRTVSLDYLMQLEANRAFSNLQFDDALPLYQRLEAIWPQDSEIQIKLGDIYRNKMTPNFQHAIFHYQRAATLGHDQDHVQLLVLITDLAATGDSGTAYAQLETILARADLSDQNRLDALRVMHNLVRFYFVEPLRAVSYLEQAVELPRMQGDIWEELQLVQISLDQSDCGIAQIWMDRAQERFVDKVSPLSLFSQLQQRTAKECG